MMFEISTIIIFRFEISVTAKSLTDTKYFGGYFYFQQSGDIAAKKYFIHLNII
jgi:hypothetical protein